MENLQAKDLRIGNKVSNGERVITVDEHVIYDNAVNCLLKPIPLTEEWLLRFGFEYYQPLGHYRLVIDDVWYQVNINEVLKDDKVFVFTFTNLNYDEFNHMPPKVLKWVHKFQNLFFEVSNEELTIK